MKKIKLLVFIGAISLGLLASGQVPQLIDYQGMARDGSGNPMANETISVRISILEGPLPGTMVYSEKHTPPTNAYGLFHLMIGDGNILFGTFNTINWASGNFFIQTEIDPAGGNAFVDMGKSKVAPCPLPSMQPAQEGAAAAPGSITVPIFIIMPEMLPSGTTALWIFCTYIQQARQMH